MNELPFPPLVNDDVPGQMYFDFFVEHLHDVMMMFGRDIVQHYTANLITTTTNTNQLFFDFTEK